MTLSSKSDNRRPLKMAVCGSGRWGRTLMSNIVALPNLELAAVISARTSLPPTLTLGAPVFDDWQTAAENVDLDGILLALPPARQPTVAEQIIKSGIPLFLEKPLALKDEAANRLARIAEDQGFIGLVDHLHLFAPEFRKLVRVARSRGEIRGITSVSGNRGPHRDSWSACWDWAPHDVSMALTVMDSVPTSVVAQIVDRAEDGGIVFENIRLIMTFSNGTVADITTGNAFDSRRREFSVALEDFTILYSESSESERALVMGHGSNMRPVQVDSVPPLTSSLMEFASRVRQGKGGDTDLALGVNVVRILSAAELSISKGLSVAIDQSVPGSTNGNVG